MSAVDKVLNNRDLYKHIYSFIPLPKSFIKCRKKVISELKHFHCEWSYHIPRCFICDRWHPCVITKGKGRRMCNECTNIVRSRTYYFFN